MSASNRDTDLIWEAFKQHQAQFMIPEGRAADMSYGDMLRYLDQPGIKDRSDEQKIKMINKLLKKKHDALGYGPLEAGVDSDGIYIPYNGEKIRSGDDDTGGTSTSSTGGTYQRRPSRDPSIPDWFVKNFGNDPTSNEDGKLKVSWYYWFSHLGDWKTMHSIALRRWRYEGGGDIAELNNDIWWDASFYETFPHAENEGPGGGIPPTDIPEEYALFKGPWFKWDPYFTTAEVFQKSYHPDMVKAYGDLIGKKRYARHTPNHDKAALTLSDESMYYPGGANLQEMEEWLGTKTPIGRKWVVETNARESFESFLNKLVPPGTGADHPFWNSYTSHPRRPSTWEVKDDKVYLDNEYDWPTPDEARRQRGTDETSYVPDEPSSSGTETYIDYD